VENGGVVITTAIQDKQTAALWGTTASHIKNMIGGVGKLFEKKLIVEGIGFKADVVGTNLVFKLGFSL
jgi:large subunit ribosomal protein L6